LNTKRDVSLSVKVKCASNVIWGKEEEDGQLTTVTLSTLSMKKSDIRYRESESAYSFHNCARSDCDDAIVVWFKMK
jgi:hypothetical protein